MRAFWHWARLQGCDTQFLRFLGYLEYIIFRSLEVEEMDTGGVGDGCLVLWAPGTSSMTK
jgi:hypothetical protein